MLVSELERLHCLTSTSLMCSFELLFGLACTCAFLSPQVSANTGVEMVPFAVQPSTHMAIMPESVHVVAGS